MDDTPEGQGNLYESEAASTSEAASNRFGGAWTEDKLGVLREYLKFYTIALKGRFDLLPLRLGRLRRNGARYGAGGREASRGGQRHPALRLRPEKATGVQLDEFAKHATAGPV